MDLLRECDKACPASFTGQHIHTHHFGQALPWNGLLILPDPSAIRASRDCASGVVSFVLSGIQALRSARMPWMVFVAIP